MHPLPWLVGEHQMFINRLTGEHDGDRIALHLRDRVRAYPEYASYGGPPRLDLPLPGVLPLMVHRVTTNRDAVIDEIRAEPVTCWWCTPEHVAFALARRRDAAEAFGDHGLADEADAILVAFRQALRRRDVAVPLFVLSQVRYPAMD